MDESTLADLDRAAEAIARADALLIGAGAGMGVDSGLPDFRGNAGFWNAYPLYAKLGLSFVQLANPGWFRRDPAFAWGFYGHRLNLYRETRPHEGFAILKRWAEALPLGAFVYTSNVDRQFSLAGFPDAAALECHGRIDMLQCLGECGADLFPAGPERIGIDPDTLRAREPLPACPSCGGLARPNILMFGDGGWNDSLVRDQHDRFERWLRRLRGVRLVVVECGAGTALPTVRNTCEAVARHSGGGLVRLNLREPEIPPKEIGLPLGALVGLTEIDKRLRTRGNA